MRRPPPALLSLALLVLAAASLPAQTNFGAVSLGSSASTPVSLTFSAPATLGSIAVVTQGAPSLDFTNAGSGTCAVSTAYAAAQSCTVKVGFSPVDPGPRYGAVLLYDPAGTLIASTLLAGSGVGPQIAFDPGAALALAPLVDGKPLHTPFGVAVDGKGDLFIADSANGRVVELPAHGAPPISIDPTVNGQSLITPGGVAVDAAGNLYIADLDSNYVVILPPNGAPPTGILLTVDGVQMNYPCGMFIDAAGDLYIADVDNARVLEVPASGAAPVVINPTVGGKSLIYPVAVALDPSGDLYIADEFANQVIEIPASGAPPFAIAPTVGGKPLYWPYGIAIDPAGNLYIADGNNRIVEVPASGAPPTAFVPTANGVPVNDPIGIALDGAGNLYVADSLNNRILQVQRSQPPPLNFAATTPGSLSPDSPQTIRIQNSGNAPLSFPVPATGSNPSLSAGFTLDTANPSACPQLTPSSSQPATLAPAASCLLPIGFLPSASTPTYGSLTLADNSLNSAAAQSFALSGNAPVASFSAVSLFYPTQQIGAFSPTQQVTFTNAGSAPLSIASIAITGPDASSFVFVNSCPSTLAAGAGCTLQGHLAPLSPGPLAASLTVTDSAPGSPHSVALSGAGIYLPSVTVTPSASSIYSVQQLAVTVSVTSPGSPVPTGSVTLTAGDVAVAPVSLTAGRAAFTLPPGFFAPGSDLLSAAYTPDSAAAADYLPAAGAATVTVAVSLPPTASTATPSALTDSSVSLAATVNPNGLDTRTWFLWGTSPTLASPAQTPAQDAGSATTPASVTAALTALNPSTTYYFQPVAQNLAGTSSGAIASFITLAAPSFTLAGTSLTLVPGATTGNTSTLTLTPANGFTGVIALSCSISPTAASDPPTCSVPASATLTGPSAQTVTLTVNTTAATAQSTPERLFRPIAGSALALLLFCAVPLGISARRRVGFFLLAALAFTLAAISACGGSGSSVPTGNPGTTPGAYTVTVTASSGALTTTAAISLTIQ